MEEIFFTAGMSSPEGLLYIVSTPIGNLKDITLRALEVLKEVDFIACEDTRHTLKLLNHYGIKKPLLSYFAPKEKEKSQRIIKLLKEGKKGALVTDSGTPLVSDPGLFLIQKCIEEGIKLVPVPGPSALLAALVVAGLDTSRFHFFGFPPRKSRKKYFLSKKELEGTLIFYERANRVKSLMKAAFEVLGDRKVVIARELTKLHEEVLRGRLSDFLEWEGKGEVVVLIGGKIL